MPLNIKYRIDSNATIPSTTSVKGSPLTSFEIDGNFRSIKEYAEGYLDQSVKTTATPSFVGVNLSSILKLGDISGDNYSDVLHYSGTAGVDYLGFPNQHGNALAIINQQGSTNEALIIGDTDNGTGTGVLFGIGHSSDAGATWSKRLELLGTGSFKRDGNLIWDAGNDGAASGLDADLLDGQHGSYYLDWTNVTNKPDPQITVTLSGDVTGSASTTLTDLANGTISVATTIAANSVALGTDTTGNYVAGLTAGTDISIAGTAGEGWSPTVNNTSTLSSVTSRGATTATAISLTNTTESNSSSTGALTVSGGVGVAKNLYVGQTLYATAKSFLIDHPTKDGMKLRHGSLEGPENGVYVRGRTKNHIIELPEYWTKLIDPDSITVQLTPIGSHQKLYVQKIENNKVYIENDVLSTDVIDCFYYIMAERIDIEKMEVEIEECQFRME